MTTDFSDGTDKEEFFCIREIREIRGQESASQIRDSRRTSLPIKEEWLVVLGFCRRQNLIREPAGKEILLGGVGRLRIVEDLPGPMERGLTNPARAGMQQRQFAPRPPWSPWHSFRFLLKCRIKS